MLKEINSLERVRAIAQPLQLRDPDTEDTEEEILDVGDVIPETEKDLKREAFVATVLHHVHSFLTRDVIGEAQKQLDGERDFHVKSIHGFVEGSRRVRSPSTKWPHCLQGFSAWSLAFGRS